MTVPTVQQGLDGALVFSQGLPGFPEARHFALVALDDAGLVYALRSIEDEGLRFLAVPPAPFFPDYSPELPDDAVTELGLESEEDALVLLLVTCTTGIEDATANLLAPIVVHARTHQAAQVVLSGSDLPLRAPLQP
ncbi:flagellar assembly protein FliW [Motilibacter rhizosphaerae]|nr:flagellar assembly protein FliW [Motilibacter rhizosphaerae]